MIRCIRWAAAVVLVAAGVAILGCSKQLRLGGSGNQLPEVTITQAPRDTNVVCSPGANSSCYAVTIHWIGFDPDGAVDRYRYTVDPPSAAGADTVWETTRSSTVRLVLPATQVIPRGPNELPYARDFHVFVVEAIDNQGARGPSETKAFFAYTQAPDVYITNPLPSNVSIPLLTPSVRISWQGTDDDGAFTKKPVRYKYTLLTQSTEYTVARALSAPDSLRIHFAPDFSTWDSVGGDTTTVQIGNLSPDQEYLFVVVGFDEAGAYSPIFHLNGNMLRFRVGFAGNLGPKITAFSEFFEYTWRASYCGNCPSQEFQLEMPANKKLTINWNAVPSAGGADLQSFRWAIDIEDLSDDTPRSSIDDVQHWSSPSLNATSVVVGPWEGNQEHRLYIESSDNLGLKSLAIIRIQSIPASFRPGSILIVKDTRHKVDNLDRATNCAEKPKGVWPTQAELDTFLFARGGAPWRCYVPAVQTPAGVFSGYTFDTLGTRVRKQDLSVKLSTLARYQHVIWITDFKGGSNVAEGTDIVNGQSALRYMSTPGRFNSLAAYGKLGGKMWLVGGGAGFGSTMPWNRTTNDQPLITFSNPLGELVQGRLMYDLAGWRSEFRSTSEAALLRRYAGRYDGRPSDEAPYTRHLSEAPARLEFKTAASEPLPPYRSNGDLFYAFTIQIEYLLQPNLVVEDTNVDPDVVETGSTLDTLYAASGVPSAGANPHNVVMTRYHGPNYPQGVLFSGFDLWSFKRVQCKQLVDFVLRRIWNIAPATTVAANAAESVSPAVPASRPTLRRPSPGRVAGTARPERGASGSLRRSDASGRAPAARDADSAPPR